MRFTAANADRLTSTNLTTANNASVWVVASYVTLPASNAGLIQATPSGLSASTLPADKSIGMWVRSNTAQIWGRGVQSDNTLSDISLATSLVANTTYIFSNVYRPTRIDQYVDNVASGNNTSHDGTLKSWTDVSIGRQSTETWNGNIAEVIFYNIALNTARRIIIDNYIAAKYGLTLAVNDVYRQDNPDNGNFDFEVAGIGRVNATNIHNDAQGSGLVRIQNPSGLDDNEFLMWGHNNATAEALENVDVPTGVEARFDRVWRFSELSATGTAVDVGNISIRFDLNNLGSITTSDLRLLIDQDNDGVFSDETPIGDAVSLGGGIYEFQNVPAGSGGSRNNKRFTIATVNLPQTPLPIELLNFKAQLINNRSVKIEWQTASETNNQFFTVEKSLDGNSWSVVNIVEGNKNSHTILNFSTIDNNVTSGLVYYRLKQTDFDGGFSYSHIIDLHIENSHEELIVYPNPTVNCVEILAHNEELNELKVFNMMGKDITNLVDIIDIGNERILINLSNLSAGNYLIKTATKSNIVIKQ